MSKISRGKAYIRHAIVDYFMIQNKLRATVTTYANKRKKSITFDLRVVFVVFYLASFWRNKQYKSSKTNWY